MRITVDLDESLLEDLARITGEKKKSPAVAKAIAEFVRMRKVREFGRLLREGAFAEAFEPDYDPSKLDS
jgi:Arc/MetJ family transcription regulator